MFEDENSNVMITSAAGASSSTSSALAEAALVEVTTRGIWPKLPRFAGFMVMSAIVARLVAAGGTAAGAEATGGAVAVCRRFASTSGVAGHDNTVVDAGEDNIFS